MDLALVLLDLLWSLAQLAGALWVGYLIWSYLTGKLVWKEDTARRGDVPGKESSPEG